MGGKMLLSIKSAALKLIFIVLFFSSLSYTQNKDISGIINLISKDNSYSSGHVLSKLAASEWRLTGITHYTSDYTIGENNVKIYEWKFHYQDTLIYGDNGEDVVRKTVKHRSGLSDSTILLDSTIYINGRVVRRTVKNEFEKFTCDYYHYDNGKVVVCKKIWADTSQWEKDSTIYFSAVVFDQLDNYKYIKERFTSRQFNNSNLQITYDSTVISECDENHYTYISNKKNSVGNISIEKVIYSSGKDYESNARISKDTLSDTWSDTVSAGRTDYQTISTSEKLDHNFIV